MDSLTSGTLAGTGSFRCESGTQRFDREPRAHGQLEASGSWLAEVRAQISEPGEYLAFEELGAHQVVSLSREWTRVGRSLAADVRFDDPTVSRRHALIVRQADGVRVLDDRSLNGVFVNGTRVEWQELHDGDEIVVGRYRLHYLRATAEQVGTPDVPGSPLGAAG